MRNIIILGITSLLTDISTEMVYPLIPLYLVAQLGATPGIVGIIEGIAESLASLLRLYSGHISDKFGKRKPLAIFGYSFSGIGKVLIYFAGAWPMVLFGRIADRFGKGIRTAPRDALIADLCPSDRKATFMGLHATLVGIGLLPASLLTGWLWTFFGPKAAFITGACLGLTAAVSMGIILGGKP